MRGQFIGVPGGSLTGDNAWAHATKGAQRAGRTAEIQTGHTLYEVTERGATVLNDLRIPIPGFSANIDHVVVHGRRVLVIDAKAWAAGRYWTLGGVTRRNLTKVPHCDKKTIPTAVTALAKLLDREGIPAQFDRPVLAVWQEKPTSFLWYRPAGNARVVLGNRFGGWLHRHVKPKVADPDIVRVLAQLTS